MIWKTRNHQWDLHSRGLIMGILNVTVDSFSDGGKYLDPDAAVEHALAMEREGADIIDIGGESTRPGAEPVAETEEMRRVLPVIRALSGRIGCVLSVDTSKAGVAQAAIDNGAEIINDVTALRGDPAMMDVARNTGAGVIAMHMRGTPRDMQRAPHYKDVVADVREFFTLTFAKLVGYDLDPMCIAFDPGIGFGKTVAHNLALLRDVEALRVADRPLVIGVSRKSFLRTLTGVSDVAGTIAPTVALTSLVRARGGNVFRVHDVRENCAALRIADAVLTGDAGGGASAS